MTHAEYQQYIRKSLLELAAKKYPGDPHRQMIYQLGYLQAQLADAMYNDSQIAAKFQANLRLRNR